MQAHGGIRIAHCIDSFDIGGTELNAIRTIEALDLERFNVTVLHFHEDGPLRARYQALGVEMVHMPISRLYSPRTMAQGMRLARLLRGRGVQILHAHDLYTNIFALPWARLLTGCQVIGSRRWLYEAPRPGLVTLNKWSYRFATRVLANSGAVARLLVEREGVPAEKVVELPNFIGESAFEPAEAGARVAQRREWGIPDDAFVVGIVARLAAVKNHAMLLCAASKLESDTNIVLIGDGPERRALERLARELGIRARVQFVGQLTSRRNLHQFFDVSVLCSRSEGFPNSIIEAMAAARPVIATPVGGVTDVVANDVTGLLVDADDAESLADRIRTLRMNSALRSRLASAGQTLVRTRYHQSVIMAQLTALYEQLAGHASRSRALAR